MDKTVSGSVAARLRSVFPEGTFTHETVMRAFEGANRETITRLHRDGQFPGIAWIQFIPDTAERRH